MDEQMYRELLSLVGRSVTVEMVAWNDNRVVFDARVHGVLDVIYSGTMCTLTQAPRNEVASFAVGSIKTVHLREQRIEVAVDIEGQ